MFYSWQLEFIKFIQQMRGPSLDGFFIFLNFLDTPQFYFLLILAVWIGYQWKMGLRLLSIVLLGEVLESYLKGYFHQPRPYEIDPSLGVMHVLEFGFPSGTAEFSLILSGVLILNWKSGWSWLIASTYVLLLSFSRLYLGVHFPTDILGGWAVGLLCLLIFVYIMSPIEKIFEKLPPLCTLLILELTLLFLLLLWRNFLIIQALPFALGVGIGLFVSHHYHLLLNKAKNIKEFILRLLVGVLGIALIYVLPLSQPIQFSLFGLFVGFSDSITFWRKLL